MLLASTIEDDPVVKALRARIGESKTPLAATGLWGSSAPILAALLGARSQGPLLYITAHLDQADDARDDMETALGRAVEVLPAWEALPGEGSGAGEIGAERARLCALLRPGGAPPTKNGAQPPAEVFVAPIQALIQPVPTPESLDAHTLVLSVGQHCEPDTIATFLVERGFERLDQVEDPGDFALRGGILDIFASTERDPVRIEFFGDRIESIRQFEVGTQRSVRTLTTTRITLPPSQAKLPSADTTTFFNYLDPRTLIVFSEPTEIAEIGRTILDRLGNPVGHFPVEAILRKAATFSQLHLSRFPTGAAADEDTFALTCESLPTFESKATDAVAQLLTMARQDPVVVYCDNQGEVDRLEELVEQAATADPMAPREIATQIGLIHQGFRWVSGADGHRQSLVVVAHHELFRRYTQKRRLRKVTATRPIESFLDLAEGDFVVHISHGIGQYVGMRTMRRGESRTSEEFLTIRFADDATMHVPASQIDLVQKYIGAKTARPPLSKLGGKRWEKTKEKVEEAVGDMAADLLRIQAVRESQPGVAYPQDTHWQTEFENAFLYTETPDQVMTLRDIKIDMARARPMDRLLCGDVGYGKTELAMRAAFKVIEFGKQAAVLVPTTVLAEQHFRTFKERMADYPFVVECLNRFRSAREQKTIIAAARAGRVDILIGTHRLLSKDVGFADLGLVVIDEEQRFGVEHKERLKQLRTTVDVLTLTATPIPRTLHMSMIGLRDISSLATPPLDRRSISTSVCAWSDTLIREAIVREMNRDGQVYFVHNRVRTIEQIANKVRTLVPEAKLLVGHGQMHGDELEEVMARFVRREADVLVCTSIIESGLDIPSANTMFIDRAELFGLADLHQLRGRVGRYKHRAYCYLLLSPNRPLTSMAAKRLKAIEEYSDLGAGFRIAMRDLEIRGAGNILGAEQSGNIAAVGYELYCQLLEKAVKRMRGELAAPRAAVHLELDVEAQIPKSYISSDRQRMECYRRFAACRTPQDVEELARDLEDAFGRYPESVETLLTVTEIKVRAMAWNIKTIIKREPDVIFSIEGEIKKVEPLFAGSAGSIRIPDGRTLHWRVPENYFHGGSLLRILVNLFRRAAGSPTVDRTEPVGGRRVTNPTKKGAITATGTSGGGVQ
ncbi:MAG TPA: transcription-repair coupling factor [Phycisphaerae bacterium]|nr:transcription-repair coupling factor [Phycisphaerae bacterium]